MRSCSKDIHHFKFAVSFPQVQNSTASGEYRGEVEVVGKGRGGWGLGDGQAGKNTGTTQRYVPGSHVTELQLTNSEKMQFPMPL